MYQALVSVVIPVYNCEAYLQQCLDSLLCQTYSNIEIILVDDGSVDSSPQICDTYARYHDNIRAIHQVNSGAAAARNMGLEYVSGDYILFVDSDDWVTADYVQNLINPALEYNADITAGGMTCFCGNRTSVLKQHLPCGCYNREQLEEMVFPILLSAEPYFTTGITPYMWGKLFKKELALGNRDALNTGLRLGEDGVFTYSALLDCNCVCITSSAGYMYRKYSTSVSQSFSPKFLAEGRLLKEIYRKLAAEKDWELGTQLDEYMAYICCDVVIKTLKTDTVHKTDKKTLLREYVASTFPQGILKKKNRKAMSVKDKCKLFLVQHRAFALLSLMIKINQTMEQ